MKLKSATILIGFSSLFAFGSQVQAKVSTPEQYMNERTKISNKTNVVRERMQTLTKNPNSASPRVISYN